MISLSIDRTSLTLAPLVITGDPSGSMWLDPSVGRPTFDYRRDYAPDSLWASGKVLLSAVRDASTLPLVVYLRAASSAALATLEGELTAALGQWSYDVTLTVDGVVRTWPAEIAAPSFELDEGLVEARMSRASVVIPVNPGA